MIPAMISTTAEKTNQPERFTARHGNRRTA
jgi:hypothetical protein